jgi:DNA-binding NtrC family response regulator
MDKKQKILFIDDDESILSAIKRELQEESYEVLTTTSSDEVLKIVAEEELAVVVIDMLMPEMGGVDLLHEVKKINPTITRLMMSGHANITILLDLINNNMIHKFITKPWPDSDALKSVVQQGLDYYNLRKEHDELLARVQAMK